MTQPTSESSISGPIPERVGSYVIERELGSGGMGTVYLGRHVESGELAAVKVLPPSMAREAGFVARFNREITAMRAVKSPHIVELYESGETDGTWYYAMEYVPGETLTEKLQREKRLPWREVIAIGVQICRALKSAHNCGVVHRDLKPSNLMIHENGTVKLTDFGIAQVFASSKLTVTGGILGTAEYMSPEQAQGKRATRQSDIYSLGAVLYVMLTGRPPFIGKTTLEIAQKHRFSQFDSPKRVVSEVPYWLDEIICKCLAKKPEDRYPDAYVLSLRLQEVPRKVDLKTGEVFEFDEGNAASDTLADVPEGGSPGQGEVGGTLVRDLFRAHVESQKQPATLWGRLFDNLWVLLGLLALLIGGGVGLSRMNRVTDDELFAQGQVLMSKPPGSAWESAERDYFSPLLERDEEKWRPLIEPYLVQIQLYELRKELEGPARRRDAAPRSEPEAIVRQALELRRSGQYAAAARKLEALQTLLAGNSSYESLHDLAGHLRQELDGAAKEAELEWVDEALVRADALANQGETGQARSIWQSVIELYDAHPGAAAQVARARERLATANRDESSPAP